MSDPAETTTPTATNGRDGDGEIRVSFSDVARAHYHWDVEADPETDECKRRRKSFLVALARFQEHAQGRVVEEYWCRKQASGIALVEVPKEPPRFAWLLKALRLWHPVPEYRLYRETDWVSGDLRKLANLLHECDVLAIKARWGLEGIHEAVVMPWLMAVETHILGFIENDWRQQREAQARNGPDTTILDAPERVVRETVQDRLRREREDDERKRAAEAEADRFYVETRRELSRIEDYYQKAGEKRARLHFVTSMMSLGLPLLGLVALVSAGGLELFGLLDPESAGVRRFYACMAAGAVGATVSVLMRMSRRDGFTIDHELGAAGVRRLGAFRPLIGAVLGVIISLLVQTTLVPIEKESLTIEFYVVVGFLAGFSERWTKVMLEGAMRTIERTGEAEPPPSATATTEATRSTETAAPYGGAKATI